MTRSMADIAAGLRDLAQEFHESYHAAAGRNGDGREGYVQAEALDVAPGEVIVVWLPASAEPHQAGDLLRFLQAQCEAAGVTIPVLVTLAESVTVEPGG